MILVEWPSRGSFRAFLDDPEHADLYPLRERGTRNHLWWLYELLEDLRPSLRVTMEALASSAWEVWGITSSMCRRVNGEG
jgi:hypothetical protein